MRLRIDDLSTATFAVVLVSFLLPFVSVSCPGVRRSFTGVQLATGMTVEEPSVVGQSTRRHIGREPLAGAAAVCALVGLAVSASLASGRGPRWVAAVLGGVSAVFLLVLRNKLEADALRQAGGVVKLTWEAGFWLALIGNVAAILVNGAAARATPPHPAGRAQHDSASPQGHESSGP